MASNIIPRCLTNAGPGDVVAMRSCDVSCKCVREFGGNSKLSYLNSCVRVKWQSLRTRIRASRSCYNPGTLFLVLCSGITTLTRTRSFTQSLITKTKRAHSECPEPKDRRRELEFYHNHYGTLCARVKNFNYPHKLNTVLVLPERGERKP